VDDALFNGEVGSMIGISLMIPSSVVGGVAITSITAGIAAAVVMRTATAAVATGTSWIATMTTATTSRSSKTTIIIHRMQLSLLPLSLWLLSLLRMPLMLLLCLLLLLFTLNLGKALGWCSWIWRTLAGGGVGRIDGGVAGLACGSSGGTTLAEQIAHALWIGHF